VTRDAGVGGDAGHVLDRVDGAGRRVPTRRRAPSGRRWPRGCSSASPGSPSSRTSRFWVCSQSKGRARSPSGSLSSPWAAATTASGRGTRPPVATRSSSGRETP
jgi:hypothetical protein